MKIYKKIGIVLILFFNFSCSNNEEKVLPQKRTLTESVYTSVTVQPDSLYQVYSAVIGLLEKNLIEEGEIVSKDQALIQVINSAPKLTIQNAQFALDLAKEKYSGSTAILHGIQDEINAALMTLKNDSINYYRQKNLWDQNIGSEVQYDTKKLSYELSQNNLKLVQSKYDRTEKELQTAVKQANNNYHTSLIANKDFTVKSAMNGKVYALYKEPGEIVNTMEALASVGSASNFILELLVDEVDIVKIANGQKIRITLYAYTNEVFT
jgi:multidrug resistance efflux pump